MNIDINDNGQLLSHFLLDHRSVVEAVADTDKWKKGKGIDVAVSFNGVELPAEMFEATLQRMLDYIESYYVDKYGAKDIDKLAEERAKVLLKEHCDNALEKIHNLCEYLDQPENLLSYAWERE